MATVLSRALLTPWSCAAQIWSRAIGCSVAASATRDHCLGFRATVSPLPVVPSFACSVASLSRFPGLERPGCQGLRPENLAGHWLGVDGARCPQELVWWFPLQSHNPSDDRRSPVTILLVARPWTCHPSFRRPAPLRPSVPFALLSEPFMSLRNERSSRGIRTGYHNKKACASASARSVP